MLAIDGSHTEVDVRNGYPGAKVGYCSVASVIMNLVEVDRLDASRPISPVDFRKTEQPSSDASALPGCNVITRDHTSARDSFREAVFDLLHDAIIDEDDHTRLLATYQALLANKPTDRIASVLSFKLRSRGVDRTKCCKLSLFITKATPADRCASNPRAI